MRLLFGPDAVELEFLCHAWHDLSCRWFEMTKIEPEQECPNLERSVMERHIKATLPLSLSRLPLSQPLSLSFHSVPISSFLSLCTHFLSLSLSRSRVFLASFGKSSTSLLRFKFFLFTSLFLLWLERLVWSPFNLFFSSSDTFFLFLPLPSIIIIVVGVVITVASLLF